MNSPIFEDKTFIVAELSANHGFDINVAKKTILAARDSGADAIKIQTYTPDTLTIDCRNEHFMVSGGTLWDGQSLYELYKTAFTPWEWTGELKEYSESIGLIFFSTPFDRTSVDFLEDHNVPLYKIASFEITDLELIEYVASKGKPVLISTGIATPEEMEDAVNTCRNIGNNNIFLLKCTSQYPSMVEDANLNTMVDIQKRFNVAVGLSDHSEGYIVPVTAVAMGAKIVEKHFVLNRDIGGPDASFSMLPDDFKEMVEKIRQVEKALGKVSYTLTDKIQASRLFARSLFIVQDMHEGDIFTRDNIRSIRPGKGLAPKYLSSFLGKRIKSDVKRGTPVSWSMLDQ
ncbi:MAG: pseudaminic acid synthase [Deltaproteobacteria bacterium]|nr:pseudaminic acid synthase [Deltaproteobacteria bacterium]